MQENCWFFVSLVQQFLHGRKRGIFVEGRLQFPNLAPKLREGIRENLRLEYHQPRPFSVRSLGAGKQWC